MAYPIPINMKRLNLGERHRHLNSLVNNTYNDKTSFEAISILPEKTPVDRLFKIDLASKHKHLEYILKNLQDDDMLYVSRALKAKWLLEDEYRHIINPTHLEDTLYPRMITTAINKMKHWIHLNLRDAVRCKEFYDFYHEIDCDYAFKFLPKCTEDIILNEVAKKETLARITPQHLKVLCEKSALVANLFYESLPKDKALLEKYIANDKKYFNGLKYILKSDADTYLNIAEQHFMPHFNRLSAISTKFIMTLQKNRFMNKPELYTSRILNIDTIAQCLNSDECEKLVLILARAKYLSDNNWFQYKNVEPFIKKIPAEKRASFKKKVFVTKDVGELVNDWPYYLPTTLFGLLKKDIHDIFLDKIEEPRDYEYFDHVLFENCSYRLGSRAVPRCAMIKQKTLLDSLFDEYRFTSFNKTLSDLRKKIRVESSSQNRMFIMLVLVSKSGGKTENIDSLFGLLSEHSNEPCQVRAAVIRSLVKRACVWRVSDDIWEIFLIFGHGLGLDGRTPEADCNEGLHAVVIRALIFHNELSSKIKSSFFKNFSTLTNYSLTTVEKQQIGEQLLNLLLRNNEQADGTFVAKALENAIDTLQAYNIQIETRLDIITAIKNLVTKDQNAATNVLKRMFTSKLGRKELILENFRVIQTDSSYINALKHDITILSADIFVKALVSDKMKAEQFLQKLNVYFNGNDDVSGSFLASIKAMKKRNKKLARPLAYLIGNELESYLLEVDITDTEIRRFTGAIRANAHVARPTHSIDSPDWRQYGAKLIANRAIKCRAVDVDRVIQQLLTWKRTARLAIVLAQRTSYEADVFEAAAKIRPTIALKTALTYFRRRGDQSDVRIWKIVKPLLAKVNISNNHLLHNIKKVDLIPFNIRPEYATEVYKVTNKSNLTYQSGSILCHILNLLPNIDENFIEAVLHEFIQNPDLQTKMQHNHITDRVIIILHFKIFSKYLLFCKTEKTLTRRFENIGRLYLNWLQMFWESEKKKISFFKSLSTITLSLKCNEVFLNEEYVSCLPTIEKIIEWMQGILPMEKYFKLYVPLNLTMLYSKAIREVAKTTPEILSDREKRCDEGCKLVGEIFGNYIGQEAKEFTQKYFDSIAELYGEGLVEYMSDFNRGRDLMIPFIIKGIIEASDGICCFLIKGLIHKYSYCFKADEKEMISKCIKEKNLIEIEFFFSNGIFFRGSRYYFIGTNLSI